MGMAPGAMVVVMAVIVVMVVMMVVAVAVTVVPRIHRSLCRIPFHGRQLAPSPCWKVKPLGHPFAFRQSGGPPSPRSATSCSRPCGRADARQGSARAAASRA